MSWRISILDFVDASGPRAPSDRMRRPARFVRATDFFEYLVDRNALHALVVGAGRQPVVERIDAGAARETGPDRVITRRERGKQLRRFGTEQGDDVNRGQGGEVCRSAVVGDEHFGQPVHDEELSDGGCPGQRHGLRRSHLTNEFCALAAHRARP